MADHGQQHEPKLVTIIVNTREHQVEKGKITFEQVVALAFPVPSGPNVTYTMTVHRGQGHSSHELLPGESVEVIDGMVFDVTPTVRS
ncbi:MAG TPA: multiubiquitin domain-containing protein [Candidatus Limnocylindrales bacterium]